MLSTPPAFILSQDRTLKKNFESQFGSNYFNKNSILRIEKGPFYFKFCILFNFQDPRFSFVFRLTFLCASVKVLVKDITQSQIKAFKTFEKNSKKYEKCS